MPDALVLAGGRPDPELAQGVPNKAFAPILGKPMVEFVLAALRGASSIKRIALVGPVRLPPSVAAYVDLSVDERETLLDNIGAGLDALGSSDPVLAVASDIPLLTPQAVDAFATAAGVLGADVVYAIIPREDAERALPGIRKTFVRVRDGTFTGGSLILLRPGAFAKARDTIEAAVRARKQPWELARLFGLQTVLGLLAGTLRIADLEQRAYEVTGLRIRAFICRTPEIGIDVDRPETLAIVQARLSAQDGSAVPG